MIGAADWAALLRRDAGRPGLYGVVTTGIACRFGCPSRAPLRGNVRLFRDLAAARAAGFRPCRRCLRDASAGSSR
jgi:AraC family transcriptional regulator of adaptative response/methylated-DNA-[protein]-cysteine methyltransferase